MAITDYQTITNTAQGVFPKSVTEHVTSGTLLGQSAIDPNKYFYKVPKGDGGFDFYSIDSTGQHIIPASEADAMAELGKNIDWNAGGGSSGGGLTAAQRQALDTNYELNKRKAQRDYDESQLAFGEKGAQIGMGREDLGKSKATSMQQNQASFAMASPDAYQSMLQNYNADIQTGYDKGMEQLATQEANLAKRKELYEQSYQDQLKALDANYAADLSGGYTGSKANVTDIDPVDAIQSTLKYFSDATAYYGSDQKGLAATKQYVSKWGLPGETVNYLTDPNNINTWLRNYDQNRIAKATQ